MGTSVQVTPLSGVYGEEPLCYLLAVDASMASGSSSTAAGPTSATPAINAMQQQQQANFLIRDDASFGGDVAAVPPEFRFSSSFNVSGGGAVEYGGAMQQPPAKYVGSNWLNFSVLVRIIG
uniref:Uncharacterized protein n=1 Tax=Oryza brachyantha TaxID=4533 RepID=J3MW33_ORYBR